MGISGPRKVENESSEAVAMGHLISHYGRNGICQLIVS